MEKKLIILFEVLCIIGFVVYYCIVELIPEYREKYGSSDTFLNSNRYVNMVEIVIDDDMDFSLAWDSKNTVFHLFFLHKNAICLYNQDIENHSFDESLSLIFPILIQKGYLKENSTFRVIRYGNEGYEQFLNSLHHSFEQYFLPQTFEETESTLEQKGMELGLSVLDPNNILQSLDYYSHEFTKESVKEEKDSETVSLNEETAKKLCNRVYQKLENFMYEHQIVNLERGNTRLIISLIPADDKGLYMPTAKSWYQVKDGKIDAYIELQDGVHTYGYCYQKSIDSVRKGEC